MAYKWFLSTYTKDYRNKKMERKMTEMIYQFKILLQGSKPPIWRLIQVPESYSFYDLHVAIQEGSVMN